MTSFTILLNERATCIKSGLLYLIPCTRLIFLFLNFLFFENPSTSFTTDRHDVESYIRWFVDLRYSVLFCFVMVFCCCRFLICFLTKFVLNCSLLVWGLIDIYFFSFCSLRSLVRECTNVVTFGNAIRFCPVLFESLFFSISLWTPYIIFSFDPFLL